MTARATASDRGPTGATALARRLGIAAGEPGVELVFWMGLALSAFMVARSQVAGDQLLLLAYGWNLAFDGEWLFYGMPTSAGGHVPGGLTSLLVGLPLVAWPDPRSPVVLLLVLHAVAYRLLDGTLAETLRPGERRAFAVLYWLSPWRIYHSAFLWTPNFMPVLGALHFVSLYRLRGRPTFGASLAHVLVLTAAVQVHPSAVLLLAASALLLWRGYFRLDRRGAAVAVVAAALSLLPWVARVLASPEAALAIEPPSRLLLPLLNEVRSLLYWLRFPTFSVSSSIACLDFSAAFGFGPGELLRPAARGFLAVLGVGGGLFALWATARLVRRGLRRMRPGLQAPRSRRGWLEGVLATSLVASLAVVLLSPTTIMSWQLLPILHLPILLVALHWGALARLRRRVARRLGAAYATASVAACLVVAFGSPMFRPGGERCGNLNTILPPMRSDHVMFDDLGLRESTDLQVNEPTGWWLEPLPEGTLPAAGESRQDR